jgi:hypothetical protein
METILDISSSTNNRRCILKNYLFSLSFKQWGLQAIPVVLTPIVYGCNKVENLMVSTVIRITGKDDFKNL